MSRTQPTGRSYDTAWLNHALRTEPTATIARLEQQYRTQLETVAQSLTVGNGGLRFVMLCGPSSAGKTTTARLLCEQLRRHGTEAAMISLDDFYRPTEEMDTAADGKPDFEAPSAIRVDRLHACVRELTDTGHTCLPRYDFHRHEALEAAVPLTCRGNTVVFLEGIHAFAPAVVEGVASCGERPKKVYVNTVSRFTEQGKTLLGRRDLRLTRRLLRDERTRSTTFYRTMTMWDDVIRGLTTYILPYTADADFTVDTTVGYEPSVMAKAMLERLPSLYGTVFEERAKQLAAAYGRFEALPPSVIPADSVLKEFV